MRLRVEIDEGGIIPGWYWGVAYYYKSDNNGYKAVLYIIPLQWIVRLIKHKEIHPHLWMDWHNFSCFFRSKIKYRKYKDGSLHRIDREYAKPTH